MPRANSTVVLCINGCNKHRMIDRRICADCHSAKQRKLSNDYTRRKRNARLNSEACNCNDPSCSGLRCNYIRPESAA